MKTKTGDMDKRESGEGPLHLSDRITQDRNHYPQWSPQTNMTNYDNENLNTENCISFSASM